MALGSLIVLFHWEVGNPLLVAATAIIGLIALPVLKPEWVLVKEVEHSDGTRAARSLGLCFTIVLAALTPAVVAA